MADKVYTTFALQEVEAMTRFCSKYAAKNFSKSRTKLSKTDYEVLACIPAVGFSLGYVSKCLIYSKALNYKPINWLKSLYSLLYRGQLEVWETDKPDFVIRTVNQPTETFGAKNE